MHQIDSTSTNRLFYSAYVVRLWQETPDVPWRASAQSVQSGEITRFGSLADLFAFLEAETFVGAERSRPPSGRDIPATE